MARAMPRVGEADEVRRKTDRVGSLIDKLPLAKIDKALNAFFEKFLRKIRVVIMKFDNLTNAYINKLRRKNRADMQLPLIHKEKKEKEDVENK